MITNLIVSLMEKTGGMHFDSHGERDAFVKIAQGEVQQAMMDPAAMQGAAMQPQMQQGIAPQDPAMMQQQAAAAPQAPQPMMGPTPSQEETIVGTSITNSDLESLIKIINVLTSLKGKYDSMKAEQMQALKDMGQIPQ